MRKICGCIILLYISLLIIGCVPKGEIGSAEIEYGKSEIFTRHELETAVDTVLKKFRDFPDCKLYTLRYSEEMTQQYQQSYGEENEYKDYEIVVYVSHFTTGPKSDREGFTPASDCDFHWILGLKNNKDEWEILNYGET